MKLQIGDEVLILRKAQDHEHGWTNTWVSEMDAAVGQIGTVTHIEPNHNVVVEISNITFTEFGYPDFVLQKIG